MTLLFGARDIEHNEAVVLRNVLVGSANVRAPPPIGGSPRAREPRDSTTIVLHGRYSPTLE